MANSLCKIAAALALLSGVTLASALASAPAFASEFSQAGEFAGSYNSVGLGVSPLSDVEVNPGPFNAGVYVSSDIAFGPPLASDAVPEEGWAPIERKSSSAPVPISAGSGQHHRHLSHPGESRGSLACASLWTFQCAIALCAI